MGAIDHCNRPAYDVFGFYRQSGTTIFEEMASNIFCSRYSKQYFSNNIKDRHKIPCCYLKFCGRFCSYARIFTPLIMTTGATTDVRSCLNSFLRPCNVFPEINTNKGGRSFYDYQTHA